MQLRHAAALSMLIAAGSAGAIAVPGPRHAAVAAPPPMSFDEDVLPVLRERCVSCHHAPDGEGYAKSGLDLTTYAGVMKGTKYGRMIVPGNPDASNLMRMIDWKADPKLRMPHGGKQLSVCDRDAIRNWIRQGAKDN